MRKKDLFGHPRGLWVLAGTELWDRISFHGMLAMLVLYMSGDLLKHPERVQKILGFAAYRSALESVTGHLSVLALSMQTFGIYMAAITALPIVGGWIGDRVTGRRFAVALGALLMTAGHFCMAFDQTFLLALLLLVLGAGFLRGNLSAQVKALYPPGDRRETDAYQMYYLAVCVGAFIAPIATGAVAAVWGWHAGFAVAGFGMLVGLLVYLLGQSALPAGGVRPSAAKSGPRPRLTAAEKRNIAGLMMIWPVSVAFWTAQAQIWNVYNVWIRDHIDLQVGRLTVPVPWFQSLDGLAPAAFIPVALWIWRRQAKRGREPDQLTKVAIGCLIFGASLVWLALAPMVSNANGRAPLLWPVMFHILSNFGAVYVAPVFLALYAGRAPNSLRGTMLGVNALSQAAASLLSGRMGGLYESVSPSTFWLINAAICSGGGVLLLAGSPALRRWFGAESEGLDGDALEAVEAEPMPA